MESESDMSSTSAAVLGCIDCNLASLKGVHLKDIKHKLTANVLQILLSKEQRQNFSWCVVSLDSKDVPRTNIFTGEKIPNLESLNRQHGNSTFCSVVYLLFDFSAR